MDAERPGYYAIIPADVRYDDRIPANAKLLYAEISALIGAAGFCYASNQYFARIYGMSADSITRLFKKLEDNGYIKREIEKDQTGQVVRRKIYLSVSVPQIQPPDFFTGTPLQKNREGTCKKDGETNTSNTNIEKENIKEKAKALTDDELRTMFVSWITERGEGRWPNTVKNQVYFALIGFYEPRSTKKQEPARTKAAFTALSNRLARYSEGDPAVMIDMLERATTAGWKSVFPLAGDRPQFQAAAGREEEWLN